MKTIGQTKGSILVGACIVVERLTETAMRQVVKRNHRPFFSSNAQLQGSGLDVPDPLIKNTDVMFCQISHRSAILTLPQHFGVISQTLLKP